MKLKRVLSLLMALVMTVSLLTLPVHAEDNDFASLTVAEQYAALKSVDNEADAQALFNTLTEAQQTALVAYAQTQAEQEYTVPQTVVFTEAGPFMPPVNVAPVRMKTMARAAAAPAEDDNGLVFEKKAKANGNGTYTITMEAYTTGEVTTSTKTVPVDIVLVLDQSGSMAYEFNGDSTNTDRRQYAMKQAVNRFIASVSEKYSTDADHRMAIVTFGTDASTLQGWTNVNEAGKSTLQGKISSLPDSPSGATNVAAGMTQAETLMGSGYSYNGSNTKRQKVVIVFTDGVPTTQTDFDTKVATNAISSAKNLKDAGATVYTVGIFNGANPSELYGASGFDTNSDGSIGSKWVKDTWGLFPGTDFPEADRPAGNRFLNYLSSNYPDATSIGLNRSTRGLGILHYKITYKITYNSTIAASNYYLTANDSTSLNNIFQTISQNIQTANIDLGSETVIKDIISPYFTAPANASDIHLYTAAAKSDGTFENRVAAPNTVKPTVTGDTVSVTGFNFNDNFVSDKVKSDGTYGKKLIIEFTVTPKAGFLGGNNVPTNGEAAVYDKDGTMVEAEVTPYVNVPIAEPDFTVNDKTIYQGNSVAVSELYTLPAYTGDDGWKDDFVTITANTGLVTGTVSPTDCESYNISVTYAPSEEAKLDSVGTANNMEGVSVTETATVHVLQPTVTATVNDVQKYYGESYTLGTDANGEINVTWTDKRTDHSNIPAASGTKPYEARDLTLAYSTEAFNGQDGIVPNSDFAVTVKVMKGDEVMPATITTTCTYGCGVAQTDEYTVHVKTCTLTITKSGCDTAKDAYQSFIFNVSGPKSMQVTVQENGTAKIVGLPVGDYTVTEDGNWSWRYTAKNAGNVTLSAAKHTDTVTITNDRTATKWLSGDNYAVNHVGGIKAQGTFVGA